MIIALWKLILSAIRTHGLVMTIGLGSAFAQPVPTTFTRISTGAIVTDPGWSFAGLWGDYNNDGLEDLFVANWDAQNDYLYQNNGDGTFTRIMTGPPVTDSAYSQDAVWGDYDNDGHLDLLVSVGILSGPRSNLLYRNQGNGTFAKITSGPIVTNLHTTVGSSWGDYDNDGYIDLFVANTGLSLSPQNKNALYRNNGAGGFTRILSGQLVNDSAQSQSCAWGDYNNDGKLDLFVANVGNNFLYRNDGNGAFTTITNGHIVNGGGSSVGSAWGDYDNDGFLDLFVGNGVTDVETNFLYRNTGTGTFDSVTTGAIATDTGGFTGCAWADYDNDGFLDLCVCEYQPGSNFLYHNNGNGTFSKVTTGRIVNDGGDSTGCAWADYDNDGFLDLFVANYGSGQVNFLYRNDGNTNQWLKIKCVGGPSNRAAIGTKVRVQAQNGVGALSWQMREISGGQGYGQNSLIAHFGLGNATSAQTVRIEWPSGIVQTLTNVAAKQLLAVTEPPLLRASVSNGSFQLLLTDSIGSTSAIEASTDLALWISLVTITNTTRTVRFADPDAANHQQRFYRALSR